ncbi:S9 family peptidase [Alsobacter sp. SYSU M60028]|uniref:S9 family peptidase n=1 Tax=Alsobacter ponti TaxID=2962936 RepID=A0ABT1L8I5_9HYPH|nr:S9 family peptidase [Alsobacter ponti]MCP8937812.1 S9 family peptidase [Alsobacter ponti]
MSDITHTAGRIAPPAIPARPHVTSLHGIEVADEFAWLKAENWREVLRDPSQLPSDIRAVLDAENAYSDAVMSELSGLQEQLVREMRARIKEDDSDAPLPDGPYAYYDSYRTGGQHKLVCRSFRDGSSPTIVLDGDALASGKPFFELGDRHHSDDHRWLAWSVDEKGSEFHRVRVRDMATLEDLPETIEDTTGDAVWDARGESFLYVAVDRNLRPRTVKRHILGQPVSTDAVVYDERREGWFVSLERSQSGAFAFISISDHETTEVRFLPRDDFSAEPVVIARRDPGVRYEVEHYADDFVILTNADGAEDFKIVTTPVATPDRANWRDLVPHRPGVMLLSIYVYSHHLVRVERENALPRIVIRSLETGVEHHIDQAEEAYALRVLSGFEFDTATLRFTYSSMTTPEETYDYDMNTRERVLMKRQTVASGHDPSRYVTRRLVATSADGALVPVSILHRADLTLDGSAPCLLYGYGAYGFATPASFESERLSLVDRGFVYAIAHIRGGTEKGWAWYTEGKRAKKPNSFRDFVAAARLLAESAYTDSGRIVANGVSAGGMLMGAVTNLAPDLLAGVIAEVPFVDVLNTMLDADLPLTPPEWPEWGNPIESAADFRTILSYAPYENVPRARLPAILAVGGLADPRVTYWEPAKWVARLRSRMTGGGPVLLHTDMSSGHGGVSGRFDRLRDVARTFAFAIGATRGLLHG